MSEPAVGSTASASLTVAASDLATTLNLEVSATDDSGEIGRGTHKRAIVSVERLLTGAARRGAKS